jgi:hypothetical protein
MWPRAPVRSAGRAAMGMLRLFQRSMIGLRLPSVMKHRSSEPDTSTLQVAQPGAACRSQIELLLPEFQRDPLSRFGWTLVSFALEIRIVATLPPQRKHRNFRANWPHRVVTTRY